MTKNYKILTNQWIVTIGGTMIGVLAAFFLNDWREMRIKNDLKSQVLNKIVEELKTNQELVSNNFLDLQKFSEAYKEISEYGDDIIMTRSEMASFQNRYPGFLLVLDSVYAGEGKFNYQDLVLNVNVPTINQLSEFAWTTAKSTNVYVRIEYECLYWLETTYGLENRLKTLFDEVFQIVSGNSAKDLHKNVKTILAFEKVLMARYEDMDFIFDGCKN